MADELNFQVQAKGFDSYLYGIIPNNQAIAAGAFSVSMQQVRNIEKVETPAFAKVVYNMEGTNELPSTNGTDIPTDPALATAAQNIYSLGSGVAGTFTTSNFFGAMSGLPYPLKNIYDNIKILETTNLKTIYQNLYLAVTWQQATATYSGSTFTYTNRGGGYGRGGVAAPTVTVGGNPATAIIGTDPNNIATYGKIVSITYSGGAGVVVIDPPPGSGWPAMNTVVQGYIDQANAEILSIKNATQNSIRVNLLNTYWNVTGTALKHEQRARFHAITPVPIPYNSRIGSSLTVFVDAIPGYASSTEPNMAVQTLENITDRTTVGGQSVVAMLREQRNKERLAEVGIELDNNIPDTLDIEQEKQLMLNGTIPGALEGISSVSTNIDGNVSTPIYTIPANPTCPQPYNYYDNGLKIITGNYVPGGIQPILNGDPNPIVNPNSPSGPGVDPAAPINPFVINQNVNTFPAPTVNSDYTGSTLCPSTYSVNEAVDNVVACNCDCWVK
jgi:hypothetical protein